MSYTKTQWLKIMNLTRKGTNIHKNEIEWLQEQLNHVVDISLEWHRKFHVNSTFITETNDKFQDHAGYLKRTSKRTGMQFHDAIESY